MARCAHIGWSLDPAATFAAQVRFWPRVRKLCSVSLEGVPLKVCLWHDLDMASEIHKRQPAIHVDKGVRLAVKRLIALGFQLAWQEQRSRACRIPLYYALV
jgi:hypothetical protein